MAFEILIIYFSGITPISKRMCFSFMCLLCNNTELHSEMQAAVLLCRIQNNTAFFCGAWVMS